MQQPPTPWSIDWRAVLVVCLLIGGLFAWLAWSWSTGLFYLLFAAVALTAAAGIARLWAGVLIYMRKHTPARLASQDDERITLANRSQGLPSGITTLNYHDSHKALPYPQQPIIDVEPMNAPRVPSFGQLLDQGLIGPGRPLILGYAADSGQPLMGSWKDLYSCGVGAQQGAGKTWLLAFLLAQSAAAGGRLIVCDLHAGDDESLANRIGSLAPAFMCDIASTPKEIETAFAFADDKLEKRKGSSARWPIVIVADEWTSLLRTSAGPSLPSHIQNIAEQGRKFNVNGMLAAQAWTKDASSAVRNQLTSHYVLRQRLDEARYQLGLRAANLPDDIRTLPDASAYLLNVKGELIKVIIPQMTNSDIARCGELIPSPASTRATFGFTAPTTALPAITARVDSNGTATGQQRDSNNELLSTAAQSQKPTSPEAAHAVDLFLAGERLPDIVRKVRNIDPAKGGRAGRQASDEVFKMISDAMQGRARS